MMALKDRFRDQNLKIGAVYPGGFESNIYENAGGGEGYPEHGQPWMMATETVANAVLFMLGQPDDANIDELVVTKHFGGKYE
jgi:NADP-dependent 3-hydroxy acid dehydrogenase YdfG